MAMVGLLIVGVIGLLVYAFFQALLSRQGHPAAAVGQWRVAHYDVKGHTRVAVHQGRPGGTHVLDEHVIAEIPVNDPNRTNSSGPPWQGHARARQSSRPRGRSQPGGNSPPSGA